MILKGSFIKSTGHARAMARHLLKNENEIVQLWEETGDGLEKDFVDMQILTKITKGRTGIFTVSIAPREYERMTPEQWQTAITMIEDEFSQPFDKAKAPDRDHPSFSNQLRVQVYHEKEGRPHLHVSWSLVDQERGRLIDVKFHKVRLQKLALKMELEFGHELTQRRANDNTIEITEQDRAIAKKRGVSIKDIQARKELLAEIWNRTQTGDELVEALQAEGLTLAAGNKARVLVIDREGFHCNLTKELPKLVKAKNVRERLGEEILQVLPTLEEATKEIIQDREAARRFQEAQEHTEEEITRQPTREPETPTEKPPERREWDEVWKEQKEDILEAERLTRDTGKKSLPELSEDGAHLSKRRRREKRRTSTRTLVGLMSQYMNLSEAERLELRQDLAERIKEDERVFYQAQAPPEIEPETPEETRHRREELEAILREQEGEDRERDRDRGHER